MFNNRVCVCVCVLMVRAWSIAEKKLPCLSGAWVANSVSVVVFGLVGSCDKVKEHTRTTHECDDTEYRCRPATTEASYSAVPGSRTTLRQNHPARRRRRQKTRCAFSLYTMLSESFSALLRPFAATRY